MALADLRVRPAPAVKARPRLSRTERAERRFAIAMITPTLIAVLAIMGYPWVYSAWMSLNFVNLLTKRWTFVWFDNYTKLFSDQSFIDSFVRTMWFSGLVVGGGTFLGLLMALALNEHFKGRGLMRSIMLMPWAVAPVVVGKLFTLIYSGEYGVLNGLLLQLGIIDNYIPFLADARRSLIMVAVAAIWQSAPLSGLLLLAGMQSIPGSLYNAARIDGAGPLHRFWKITLPWLRPMMLLVVILNTINAIMTFDLIFVITSGGPGEATTVLSWLGYITFFNFSRYGEGTAILYILSLVSLSLAVIYFRLLAGRGGSRIATEATPTDEAEVSAIRPWRVDLQLRKPAVRQPLLPPRVSKRLRRVGLYTAIAVIAFWSLAPFYILVNASLSDTNGILNQPPDWFPSPLTLESYQAVTFGEELNSGFAEERQAGNVQAKAIMISMKNSAIVAIAVTIINVLIGAPAGYAYARYARFRFTSISLWILMMTRMIPPLT
ncbi:MAG: multiple sugar transport system permease protein, partial [Thermomicrobiales bacterium]|nr:multiple sugar transport system permease protein [Thermomicrobiales bacterium]